MSKSRTASIVLSFLGLFVFLTGAAMAEDRIEFVDSEGRPAEFYLESSRAIILLTLPGANDPSQEDSVLGEISSALSGDVETLYLYETGVDTGIFRSEILTRLDPPQPGNFVMEIAESAGPPHRFDTLTATFHGPDGSLTDTVGLLGSLTTFLDEYGRDVASFATGSRVYVRVEDQNINHTASFDRALVTVRSLATGDAETIWIFETAMGSGVFEGSLPLADGAPPASNDGRLQAGPGEEIEASHTDRLGHVASGDRAAIGHVAIDFFEDSRPAVAVLENGTARVRVFSLPDNPDPFAADSVTVEVRSRYAGDSEALTLTETGTNTNVFEGTIGLAFQPAAPGNGTLETLGSGAPDFAPEEVTARYGPYESTVRTVGSRVFFLDAFGRVTDRFALGDTVRVRIVDYPRNDPGARDSFPITVGSPETGDSETVVMTETGFNTGIFEGSIASAEGSSPGSDGVLRTVLGGMVEAVHQNANSPTPTVATARMAFGVLFFTDAQGNPVSTILESARGYLRLISPLANTDPQSEDFFEATVISTLRGGSATAYLSETGPSTGVFRGEFLTDAGTVYRGPSALPVFENAGPPHEFDTVAAYVYGPDNEAVLATAGTLGSRTWLLDSFGAVTGSYATGSRVHVRVEDQNRNNYIPTPFDKVPVTVRSLETGDVETIQILETAYDSGIFEGSLPLADGGSAVLGDGRLQARPGEPVEARHDDALGLSFSSARAVIDFASILFVDEEGLPAVSVLENGTARVRVFSLTDDRDPFAADSLTIEVRSRYAVDSESLTLTETGESTRVFEGTIGLAFQPAVPGNGRLETLGSGAPEFAPEEITARYGPYEATVRTIGSRIFFIDAFGETTDRFALGDRARVRIVDHLRNDPGARDSFPITVSSPETGDSETVAMTETGFDTGVFEGSVATAQGNAAGDDGVLRTVLGGTIEAAHQNASSPSFAVARARMAIGVLFFSDAQGNPVSTILESGKGYLRLISPLTDTDPQIEESFAVSVFSAVAHGSITVDLYETGPSTGVFRGEFQTDAGIVSWGPNALPVRENAGPPHEFDTVTSAIYEPNGEPAALARVTVLGSRTWLLEDAGEVADSYATGSRVYLRVEDQNRNKPLPGFFDEVSVTVRSLATGDVETFQIRETAYDSGIFEGALQLVDGGAAAPGDGSLQARAGERIEARHDDALGLSFSSAEAAIEFASIRFVDETGRPLVEVLENGAARVRVFSSTDNADPFARNSLTVEVRSRYAGDSEALELAETGVDTSVFEGEIGLRFQPAAPGNGTLETLGSGAPEFAPEEITARYGPYAATARTVPSRVFFLDASGQVTDVYPVGAAVRVRVEDRSRNAPGQVDSFPLRVRSLSMGDEETLWMTETGTDTGVFEGEIPSTGAPTPAESGALSVEDGQEIEAEHQNASRPLPTVARATFSSSAGPTPLVGDDTAETNAGRPVVVPVLDNDVDPTGGALSIASVTQPPNGSAEINPDGTITYTPNAGFAGEDFFLYTAVNALGGQAEAIVRVTVLPNRPPQPQPDQYTTQEDTFTFLDILANDFDPDGDSLRISGWTNPPSSVGRLISNFNGTGFTFVPALNFSGQANFTYFVQDPSGAEVGTGVTVFITPVNDPPVARDDTAAVAEDGSVKIAVLANDTDVDGPALNVTAVTQGARGTVSINADKTVQYTPAANVSGTDTFNYTISDGSRTATAKVTVTITPVNDPPAANADAATVAEDTSVAVSVLANDTDVEGDVLSVTAVTQGARGAVVINANKTLSYTPAANFNGTDSFTYTASDGKGGSATATVSVTVTPVADPPVAVADVATVEEDGSVAVAVLANDTAGEGVPTVTSVTQGTHGTVTIHPDKTVTYAPAANFHGADTFIYTIADDGGSATATVTVTITPVNDAPVALDDAGTADEDASAPVFLLANDTDVEGEKLTVIAVTQPAHGTVTIAPLANGAYYQGNQDFNGSDTFTYTIQDPHGATATATVTMTVRPVNDLPVANPDAATVAEDETVVIDVLANDTDIDGDALSLYLYASGAHGAVTRHPDGRRLIYLPSANFHGTDTFKYRMLDVANGSDVGTVTVTVTPVNDAPVAVDDAVTVPEDGSVAVTILANDTDVERDALEVASVTQGARGAVTLNPDGTVTYTPAVDFNGADAFTYTVSDGHGGSDTATVAVTVTAVNDTPIANPDAATVDEDGAVAVAVLDNDADPENDALAVTSVTQGAHGTVSLGAAGTVTYTPAADFNGADAFTYTIADGTGATATGIVTIAVTPVNDAPVAADDDASTVAGAVVSISVLANDTDVDGPALAVASVTEGAHGTVVVEADGTVTYTAGPFLGSDSFTYTVTDGAGGIATATVTVSMGAPPRIATGIQALYDFEEGSGSIVHDVSGVGAPLDLTIANPAATSWQPGALSIDAATLVASRGAATKVIDAARASNALTLEAWIAPGSLTQTGPAAIVTLSKNPGKRNFTLGQQGSAFEALLRTTATDQNGNPGLPAPGTVSAELVHVVYTRSVTGEAILYVNGAPAVTGLVGGDLSSWDASFELALGNELTPNRPWLGDLHLVAVYGRALTGEEVKLNFLAGHTGE